MKSIRSKHWPHPWVKPVNRKGAVVLEKCEEPFKIPDSMSIETLSTIWGEKLLKDHYELVPLRG